MLAALVHHADTDKFAVDEVGGQRLPRFADADQYIEKQRWLLAFSLTAGYEVNRRTKGCDRLSRDNMSHSQAGFSSIQSALVERQCHIQPFNSAIQYQVKMPARFIGINSRYGVGEASCRRMIAMDVPATRRPE